MGQAETAAAEELKWQIHDLSFGVHESRRYHEMMCAFYAAWANWMKIVTVFSGSGAFFLIFAGAEKVGGAISAFIAMWAILDIVISPDKRVKQHADLGKRFTALAANIELGSPLSAETYRELAAERLKIEEDEPPCKRLIDIKARNDECRARGYGNQAPLDWWQRKFGYFATSGMAKLERWKEEQRRSEADATDAALGQGA